MSGVVDHMVLADREGLNRLRVVGAESAEDIAGALAAYASHARTTGRPYTLARQALLVHAMGAPSSAAALSDGRQRLIAWGSDVLRSIGTNRPEEKAALIVSMVEGEINATVLMDIAVGESALRSAITAIINDPQVP